VGALNWGDSVGYWYGSVELNRELQKYLEGHGIAVENRNRAGSDRWRGELPTNYICDCRTITLKDQRVVNLNGPLNSNIVTTVIQMQCVECCFS